MRTIRCVVLVAALTVASCGSTTIESTPDAIERTPTATPSPLPTAPPTPEPTPEPTPGPVVRVGAEVLVDMGFAALEGQRVGLIANQTSRADDEHMIDLLHAAPDVELTAVFAPEHGVRGKVEAGQVALDTVDFATGVTIFSLYGENRSPTPEMLAEVDVLVYDLQDVGTRFYTFISTMGLAMQSAAAAGIPFVVLDRPNPIGGSISAGFTLEESQLSFVGQYPIPAAYGMTAGELALAIRGEGWLPGLESLEVRVIEMQGWDRAMLWPDTGREWIAPSPGLPTFDATLAYPGSVLFEATSISYGGGTREPFAIFGAAWGDGARLAEELNGRGLPGVEFEAVTFTPMPIVGLTLDPRLNGELMEGVRYVITDPATFRPVATGVHVLDAFYRLAGELEVADYLNRPEFFDLLAGTGRLHDQLAEGLAAAEIVASWQAEAAAFDALREPYLLYD